MTRFRKNFILFHHFFGATKNVLKKFILICLVGIVGNVSALEIRPFIGGYGPSESSIVARNKGVKSIRDWDSEHQFIAGAEMNFSAEFLPIRYGFGLGYKSTLKEENTEIIPASIPVWGSFALGRINTDNFFSPYFIGRAGFLPLVTSEGCWWELPINFFMAGGAGVILPMSIGLEVYYEYSSVLKSYEYNDVSFRVSTGKLGVRLSIGFEVSHDKVYSPHNRTTVKDPESEEAELFEIEDEDAAKEAAEKEAAEKAAAEKAAKEAAEKAAAEKAAKEAAEKEAAEKAAAEAAAKQKEELLEMQEKSTTDKRKDNLRKKASKSSKNTKKAPAKTKAKTKAKTARRHR